MLTFVGTGNTAQEAVEKAQDRYNEVMDHYTKVVHLHTSLTVEPANEYVSAEYSFVITVVTE